ncbi:MAG TPA: (S)-ureidoglycine aminohydrolase [Phycisphaerae bacterium]|nr:(S)-ureidoglycine aminohydrolase [Phycisphaerae bacterium]
MSLDLNKLPRILPQGVTRSKVTSRYALLTQDTFVPSVLPAPHWTATRGVVQISPAMGARFLQYEAHLTVESIGHSAAAGIQRLVYVLDGQLHVHLGKGKKTLRPGGFAYLPVGTEYQLRAPKHARVLVIEKMYGRLAGTNTPEPMIGHESEKKAGAFLGDEALQLKLLLPDVPAMDMAVNIFEYAPGGTLPQVEIHVMEHGLMMLEGAGVYRLGDEWFPVQAGDVIWMAPYCEQWFVAMGKRPARYIYYKDVNRNALG